MPTVLIVYEDLPAGREAMRMLGVAFAGLPDASEFEALLWRFDQLENPECSALASADAISADIIVVSTSASDELTVAVKEWIEQSLAKKRGASAAVVGLLGSAEAKTGDHSETLQFLRDAAREAGVDFFAPSQTMPLNRIAENPLDSPTLSQNRLPDRYWGLNE